MFRYKIENDISISSTRKKISAKIDVYIRIHRHIYKTLVISQGIVPAYNISFGAMIISLY